MKVPTIFQDFFILISSFSLDALIILIMFVALLIYALHYGEHRIVSLILSLYAALLLYIHFPYTEKLIFFKETQFQIFLSHTLIFFIFVLIFHIILNRIIYIEFPKRGLKRIVEAVLLAVFTTGLLLAFSYHVLPSVGIYDFAGSVDRFFDGTPLFFLWLILPPIGLFFITRR